MTHSPVEHRADLGRQPGYCRVANSGKSATVMAKTSADECTGPKGRPAISARSMTPPAATEAAVAASALRSPRSRPAVPMTTGKPSM